MNTKVKVIRQGDVYIILDQPKPENIAAREDRVLAVGEATGHNHVLTEGKVYGELAGKQWIVLEQPAEIIHQEHATVTVPIGVHEVRIQREYQPREIVRIRD
jgi:hypothetical protein